MKILIVEDDLETSQYVSEFLALEGHQIDQVDDGIDGLAVARKNSYACLILDRMLPGLDGLALLQTLRSENDATPALMLTAMAGLDDKIEGLACGADDYLVKPFASRELSARVHAITRQRGATARLSVGNIEMDLITRTVHYAGKQIELRWREFALLEYLMRNAGQLVTRSMLLENVWNLHFDPRTKIVETHLSHLRSKLGAGDLIRTIRGVGYIFGIQTTEVLPRRAEESRLRQPSSTPSMLTGA